jgi:hypothetical protein
LNLAQKEFVGNVRSTYAIWAAVLGNMRVARLHTLSDSIGLRQRYGISFQKHLSYEWTNPELAYNTCDWKRTNSKWSVRSKGHTMRGAKLLSVEVFVYILDRKLHEL